MNVATPLAFTVPVAPICVAPSINLTVPLVTAELLDTSSTVAVNVTDVPVITGDAGDAVRITLVALVGFAAWAIAVSDPSITSSANKALDRADDDRHHTEIDESKATF